MGGRRGVAWLGFAGHLLAIGGDTLRTNFESVTYQQWWPSFLDFAQKVGGNAVEPFDSHLYRSIAFCVA